MFFNAKLRLKQIVPFVGVCALLIGATNYVSAVAKLDPSFGNNGKVITSLGEMYDIAYAVAVQPDGKIVAAGSSLNGDTVESQIAVVRYNASGSLDNSFGNNGVVKTSIGEGNLARAFALGLLPTGKILVSGAVLNAGDNNHDFALVRYNSDGSLDQSFGNGGKIVTALTGGADIARDMVIQPDGKIVLVGYVQRATEFGIARYNSDGSLDTGFGSNGIIIARINNAPTDIRTVALQSDGRIVLGGGRLNSSEYESALIRYNSDGSLDQSFGNGSGFVITRVGNQSSIVNDLVIQPDGKILAGGISDAHYAAVRYEPNGSLDQQFGYGGKVTTVITPREDYAASLLLRSNGEIFLSGFSLVKIENDVYDYDFTLARYRPNGSLIETTITSFGNLDDGAWATTIQPDGKLILAGQAQSGGTVYDFALARYTLPGRGSFDYDGDGRSDVSVFRPSNATWYLQQSGAGFSAVSFGAADDRLAPADYDGDGKTDLAVFRDGAWYLLRSSAGFIGVPFGQAGDVPQPADFDGDGKAELAVFRPSTGTWYTLNLTNNQSNIVQFGQTGDKAIASDYDGDGKADYAVYRPAEGAWYLLRSTQGFTAIPFGIATDRPVPADYDGDGKTDTALYRDGVWYIQKSSQGITIVPFGLATDVPVPADYDGDGQTDVAIFRDGAWYLQQSASGLTSVPFGTAGDKPVPAAFVP